MTMPLIHVIGVSLPRAQRFSPVVQSILQSAPLLIGARRRLSAVAELTAATAERWVLGDLTQILEDLRSYLQTYPQAQVVMLATGDPLFFGIGRLLLSAFPPEQLAFHPQLSSIQLAFSRLKMTWQDATLVSVHGRGEEMLCKALKRGDSKIAVLTDGHLTPRAIAQLIRALELPIHYRQWVCENLGAADERVSLYNNACTTDPFFAALNVVVLVRIVAAPSIDSSAAIPSLPLIGLPDSAFKGYPDRPMLMTKREIRLLVLGALAPLDHQVIWDIGAGTGSISVELSRLCPHAQIYAIEKSAMGAALIAQNAQRLAIAPIKVIHGKAPTAFTNLPIPNRVFIGGSSGQLISILNYLYNLLSRQEKNSDTRIVLSLATMEHLAEVTIWLSQPQIAQCWQQSCVQANISRSLPVGSLTRFSPLNPVTILTLVSKSTK